MFSYDLPNMEKLDKFSVFTKLFQNKKHSHKHNCKWSALDHGKGCSPPNFNTDNIRLVVILRSHNTSSGRVLYDSKSEPRPIINAQCCKKKGLFKSRQLRGQQGEDVCMPCGRPRPRLASDTKMLEEVMFGSAPMIQKGSSLKVHSMQNPPQLMVTKVFVPATSNKGPSVEHETFDLYSVQSMSVDSAPKHILLAEHPGPASVAQSVPVDVPLPSKRHSDDTEDSGISASLASSCSSSFTTSGYSPSSSASLSSINSLTRRLLRNQTTSFEYSFAKRLSDESTEFLQPSHRPPSLGFGITFTLPEENTDTFRYFESFFFSHITLIESHVVKLKIAVEKALQKHNKHMVAEALSVFRSAVYDLYTAPRLSEPVWLNMMCYTSQRVALYQNFLKEFMSVMDKYDTKNTKFFVSTLVTAVLTHHLAWVPTVTPAGATPSRTYLDKHSAKWLDAIAKSHPYNPLWAQLGDLYGAIGFPLRLSRTVIIGQKADLVCKLLHILSYFIRCSDVHERTVTRPTLDNIDGHIDIPGMNPIEEDELFDGADNGSSGKRYGSATSYATVRHASLQTSTDTILSSKSDITVIERYLSNQKDPTDNQLPGDLNLSSLCNQVIKTEESEQGMCQCLKDSTHPSVGEPSDDDLESRGNECDAQIIGQSDGRIGNSVFYCCIDDVYGNRKNSGSNQCNFDTYLTTQWSKMTDAALESDSDTDSTGSAVSDGGVMARGADVTDIEPLLLFRDLNEDPGLATSCLCDTSFSMSLLSPKPCCCLDDQGEHSCDDDTSAADVRTSDSVCTVTAFAGLLDKPRMSRSQEIQLTQDMPRSPWEHHLSEGNLHTYDKRTTSRSISESIPGSNVSKNLARCKLIGAEEIEGLVKVARMRHVGHVADAEVQLPVSNIQNITSDKHTHSDSCHLPDTMITGTQEGFVVSAQSCLGSQNSDDGQEKDSRSLIKDAGVTQVQSGRDSGADEKACECSSISHACCNKTCAPSGTTVVSNHSCLCSENSSQRLPSRSFDLQKLPAQGGLYPKLDEHNTALDITLPAPVTHSVYPQVCVGSRPEEETQKTVEGFTSAEPGCVNLIQADLGTLYPVIVDNTVISTVNKPVYTQKQVSVENADVSSSTSETSACGASFHIADGKYQHSSNCNVGMVIPEQEANAMPCSQSGQPTELTTIEGEVLNSSHVNSDFIRPPANEAVTHSKVSAWLRTNSESSGTSSSSSSDGTEKDDNVNPHQSPARASKSTNSENKTSGRPSLSKRALMDRQDSTFDEYFTDNSVMLPDLKELEDNIPSAAALPCQRLCSRDSNNSVFLTDAQSAACQNQRGQVRALDVHDEYFREDFEAVHLPQGPTKDMITDTLNFMQELEADDINMDDVLEGMIDAGSSENWGAFSKQNSLNRQQSNSSGGSQQNSMTMNTLARCRAVTPVELGRRRHGSAASNVSWEPDMSDTSTSVKDIPMPRVPSQSNDENLTPFECNFGNSLLAGYSDHYMSDFVLHGNSDSYPRLLTKLQTDLSIALQNSVLDEPITEACCIVADTDKWMVRLHTCQCVAPDQMRQMDLSASQMVCNILESVNKLWKLKMSPEFCLMHLEDRLQEIYFKSKMLSEYIRVHKKIDLKELSTALGFDISDMPLLLAVAGTHTPHLALALSK